MIETKTHKTSGSGSAGMRWSMFGARGALLNQEGEGGGGGGGTAAPANTTTTTTQPTTSTTSTNSEPGTAPGGGGETFTKEQVNEIVRKRLDEDRSRRGNVQPAKPAAPGDTLTRDEAETIMARAIAFEHVVARSELTPGQRVEMLKALRRDNPEDVAVWGKGYLETWGIGKSAPATTTTTTQNPNGNAAAPKQPHTAAPASPAGNTVNPTTSGGLVDFWRFESPAQLDQLGGKQLRAEFEKHIAEGQRLSGAPPVPRALQQRK